MYKLINKFTLGMCLGGLILSTVACDPDLEDLSLQSNASAVEGISGIGDTVIDTDNVVDAAPVDPLDRTGIPDVDVDTSTMPDSGTDDTVVTAPHPILINADFTKLPKSSGSDCACSAWINKDIGDQAESTSGNGGSDNVTKIDNDEQDAGYQEFEVVKNAEYKLSISVGFDALLNGSFPAVLELRVLAGSGYITDYVPTYFGETIEFPQSEAYGYRTTDQLEIEANNLLTETIAHPGNTDYITYEYTFNAGDNDSVAIYFRGINGDGTPADGQDKGHNFTSGDEEIQIDSITVLSVNLP